MLFTPTPTVYYATSPGLENNPGRDAKLFNDTHPYFPDSCDSCPFFGGKLSVLTNKVKDCGHCQYIDSALPVAKKETLTPDEDFGERLLVSSMADKTELEANIRCAKSILGSFPDDIITIRSHSNESGVKNPEYLINNLLADRKGVASAEGITDSFRKAIAQGCKAVVIDLDSDNMKSKSLQVHRISKKIEWRHVDFESGTIQLCYVVYGGRSVKITKALKLEEIESVIKQLKP